MIRRPPRSTQGVSSAASDVYKRQDNGLHKVMYNGSRIVRTEWISRWLLAGDLDAQRRIDAACLLTKAPQWSYEKEWRMLDRIGVSPSKLNFRSVIFGMRCPRSVQYAVVAALGGIKARVKFWAISAPDPHFALRRVRIDLNELLASFPRTSIYNEFSEVSVRTN